MKLDAPRRIQRKRERGWKMPSNTIYVGRPTEWGNLWTVGLVHCGCRSVGECNHNNFRCETAAEAVEMFRKWITGELAQQSTTKLAERARQELRSKNLACWCDLNKPCHADVLLEIANR